MPSLDVFNSDAFTLQALTAAVNKIPFNPGRITELGLFRQQAETETKISVEFKNGVLYLVGNKVRGSGAHTAHQDEVRTAYPLNCTHLPIRTSVLADEVQNVRAFGTENVSETVMSRVGTKLAAAQESLAATLEYHMMGALKGIVLDSDGATTIYNLFTLFGITPVTAVSYELDVTATKIRTQIQATYRAIARALGGTPFSGIHVFCSDTFFDALIDHDDVRDQYKNWSDNNTSNKAFNTFPYAGAVFENYRGKIGSVDFLATDTAIAFPVGVPDMFVEHNCPADYTEAVNTPGQRFYAKQQRMDFDKGIEIEVQSNPLMINHRPEAVIPLTRTD